MTIVEPAHTADLLARVRAEIDSRMAELRPAVAEHERLLVAAAALELDIDAADRPPATERAASGAARPTRAKRAAARRPASAAGRTTRAPSAARGAGQQAIVAALEHGSHTVSELVVVTAMPGAEIRDGLRRLQRAGTITRASRQGRIAYALAGAA